MNPTAKIAQSAGPAPARAPPAKAAAKTSGAAAMRRQLGNAGMRAAIGQQKDKGEAPGKKGAAKGGGKPDLKLVAGKDKTGGGAAAAAPGTDQAAGGKEKAAPTAVAMHMPEPPDQVSPATMKRIAGTKARAGDTAASQGTLPPADKQVDDARGAVVPPEAERTAKAQEQLIAEMNAAPSPEIEKLCERIREVIRNKRPPDEDALAAAEPSKEAMDAGNQLNSTVKDETGKVQDNYGDLNKSPAVPAAPDSPGLNPQPPAASTAPVNATAATPDAVAPQNVSLDKDTADSKAKIEKAGMEKPAAQLIQNGPIAEAREAQGELNQTAQESPAQVLAKQKETLGAAKADMTALGADALAALSASRTAGVQRAEGQKGGMVLSEDQMRTNAGMEAKAAFTAAQTAVEGLLKSLPDKAMAEWDAGKAMFVSAFKADLKIVEDRVKERHSGVGGWFVGIWDAVTGLPGWAEEAYSKAETRFADSVIAKIREISTKVNAIILACEKIITDARAKINGIYDKLPASLQGWAAGEQAKFQSQLDKLQQQATSTRDNFNKGLVQQAASAVDEVRAEIAELRKKAGGLIGRIVAAIDRFLDDPIKFIIDGLLELVGIPPAAFWALVAKIKKVAADIADDPEGFANNLLKGLGQGFTQFFDNFGSHLIKGFLTWLLGDLKGVQIPKDVSLKSIATFFLQLMGITWPNIREILSRKIGPKNMALIEKAYSILSQLIEKGPEGIYEMIKEKLDPQAIVDQVIEMAVEYMVTAIAKNVAARLLLLFNPVGAIAQAIEAIYRVLKWVFQNAARIFRLIEAVVNGLADIVAGNVGGFANAVEKALGMLIAPVIGFIADYCNLGDLPQVVAKQIKSFQKMVLGFVEKAIDWIIDKGKALLAAVGIGGKKDEKKKDAQGDDAETVGKTVPFSADGEEHSLWIEVQGDNATVMVASVKQKLIDFLNGDRVKTAIEQDDSGTLKSLVAKVRNGLKPVDVKADNIVRKMHDIRKQTEASGGSAANLDADKKAVESSEDELANDLAKVFELVGGKGLKISEVIGLPVDPLAEEPKGYRFYEPALRKRYRELRRQQGFGEKKGFPRVWIDKVGVISKVEGPHRYDLDLVERYEIAVAEAEAKNGGGLDGSPRSPIANLESRWLRNDSENDAPARGHREAMEAIILANNGLGKLTGIEVSIAGARADYIVKEGSVERLVEVKAFKKLEFGEGTSARTKLRNQIRAYVNEAAGRTRIAKTGAYVCEVVIQFRTSPEDKETLRDLVDYEVANALRRKPPITINYEGLD